MRTPRGFVERHRAGADGFGFVSWSCSAERGAVPNPGRITFFRCSRSLLRSRRVRLLVRRQRAFAVDISIRNATETDLPAIVDIYNQSIPGGWSTADTNPITVADRVEWFRKFDPAKRPIWVAEVDG